jgi:hypothetical protein
MLNLGSVSQSDAAILKALDKADNKNNDSDNKIVLKNLSQTEKNELKSTLERIGQSTDLSPEDKTAISFTLKSLNGQKGGSSFLELKGEVNQMNFPRPPAKAAQVKAEPLKNSEPIVNLFDQPVSADTVHVTLITQEQMDEIMQLKAAHAKEQADLGNDFKKGKAMVYSQNFGIMDTPHIRHNSLAFITFYNAAVKSAETGQPQSVTMEYGHGRKFTYSLNAKPGDDFIRMAREIASDASFRYEDSTSYWGGFINKAAEVFGRGSSAFSTEDLASNALGIHAGEEYIKSLTSTPNSPSQETKDKLAGIGAPPSTNPAGEATADWAQNWILAHAGELYKESATGVERTSYGNDSKFYPVHSKLSNINRPNPSELEFYNKINAESAERGGHMSGKGNGWHFEDD